MTVSDTRHGDPPNEERDLRARIGLGVKMLTNAGYAMFGGTFFKAVTERQPVGSANLLWAGAGLLALAAALYFTPMGTADES